MKQVFDDSIVLAKGLKSSTQPEMWYADGWPPKNQFIAVARGVREEVYTDFYRRFCWRIAFEQLVMSFHVTSNDADAQHRAIQEPVLLASGADDNYNWANIYERTRDLANRLEERAVTGGAYLLAATGHSIHDERPKFFAAKLLEFLES
jgi:pimeloyl-ACP methyl ester carboxylesterase